MFARQSFPSHFPFLWSSATAGHSRSYASSPTLTYVLLTLGVKQRGLSSDRAFDHTSGIGYVPPHDGHYSDGLAKGNTILLLISEIFGAVNGVSLRFLTRLSHRFKGCKDIKYHDRGGREVSFLSLIHI